MGKLKNINDFFKDIAFKISGTHSYVNNKYIEGYLGEVRDDISVLEDYHELCAFEKEQEESYSFIAQKYKDDYCPSAFYRHFSFESHVKYLQLREQIDDLLAK